MRLRISILALAAVGLAAIIGVPLAIEADGDGHARGAAAKSFDGAWIFQSDLGFLVSVTFTEGRPGSRLVTASGHFVDSNPTLGGAFPDVSFDRPGLLRGTGVRTAPGTLEYRWVLYGLTADREIIYIIVGDGMMQLSGDGTADDAVVGSVYSAREQVNPAFGPLPDQDADNDGFPDPGQEPLFTIEGHNIARRVAP